MLSNIITELKNSLKGFIIRLDQAEKKISKLGGRSCEIIVSEEQKENSIKKSVESMKDLWDPIKWTKVCIMKVPEEKREKREQRVYLKK